LISLDLTIFPNYVCIRVLFQYKSFLFSIESDDYVYWDILYFKDYCHKYDYQYFFDEDKLKDQLSNDIDVVFLSFDEIKRYFFQ